MSQVRKFQQGGTAPKAEQQYSVKVNGNTLNLGHEQLQSWFNDYVKAGGGKTKNRDEWNTNFNDLLGTIKDSNSKGQTFDFDLQGDTIGAIDYTGDKGSLTNEQLGLKDSGQAAKAGFGAGITGVKNTSAMRASLLSGLADYSGKSYTETMSNLDRENKIREAKEKAELEKKKTEGLSNYSGRLSSFKKQLDPSSRFKGLDGKNASMDYAVTQYNKLDEKGRKQFMANYGSDLAKELNQLSIDSQSDPEYHKAFEGEFGKDVMNRLKGYGTTAFDPVKFLRDSNPETIDMFTNPETYNKINIKNTPTPIRTQNPDGTWSDGSGVVLADDKGTKFNGRNANGQLLINGVLAQGSHEGLRWNQGVPFSGLENNLKWNEGTLYSGPDAEEGQRYDYTNYKSIPLRLEGKEVDFDTFIKESANNPKYKGLSEAAKKILEMGKISDLDQWTEGNSKLERNAYDPYEGLSHLVPQRYKNLSGAFSNFDPSKGAILQEFRGKYDANGNPITNLVLRRGKFRTNAKITMDRLGRYTVQAANGDKIFLGTSMGDKPNDITNAKYNFSQKATDLNKSTYSDASGKQHTFIKGAPNFKEGGKLEQLQKLQYGGLITGQEGKKEKYHEVGLGEAISDPNYKMTTTDKFQLGALVADIGSLAATAIPGIGNATAAGVGAIGTLTNLGANVAKDGFQLADAGEAAIGLGLDALTLLPGLGTGAKSAKILRALKGSSKAIGLALAGVGAYQAQDSFRKIIDGKATMDDWRHLATGLTGALSGKRMAFDNALATSKGAVTATIKDAKGEKYVLDNATSALLQETKSAKDKANIAKNYIAGQMNKGIVGPHIPASAVELEKGFGLKGWKPTMQADKVNINSTSGERTLDNLTEDASLFSSPMAWMKNRAIKRVAMGNPTMTGAEDVLGDGNKLKSTFWGRKFALTPSGNIKSTANTPTTTTGASATESIGDSRSFSLSGDQTPQFGLRIGNSPTEISTASTVKGVRSVPTEQEEIVRKGNKLMNIYVPKSKKIRTEAPQETFMNPVKVDKSKSINYLDVKPKKQEQVKRALEGKTSSEDGPVTAEWSKPGRQSGKTTVEQPQREIKTPTTSEQKEVKNLRRKLGLATNKEHDIKLEDIFSAPKGTVKESLAKRILKDKKLAKVVEKAIDEGKTSIKLQTGGIIKKGVKIFDMFKDLDKPKVPYSSLNTTPTQDLTSKYTTGINSVIGIPEKQTAYPSVSPITKPLPKSNNLLDTGIRGVTPTPKEIVGKPNFLSQFLKGIDPGTVSELGRAFYNRNLSKNVDTRMSVPLAQHVAEVYTPIKGDLTLKSAYNRSADRIVADAGRPRTSDAMIDLAGKLSSNKQAEDLRLQGDAANAEAIARTEAQNVAQQQTYAQSRQQVANQNLQALAQKEQIERQGKNQKMLAMGKSIDNFWASQNQKNYMQDQQNKAYDSEIAGLGVASKFSDAMGKVRGDAETAWSAYTKAQESGDVAAIDAAKKVYDDAVLKGTRVNNNLRYIQMQLQKDPKWNYADKDIYSDLIGGNKSVNQKAGLKFFTTRPKAFASGGKMSVQDKFALEEYKAMNKAFASDAKEYNSWIKMRMKEDRKEQAVISKSLSNMISTALKGK